MNIVPSDKPSDIYRLVADKTKTGLTALTNLNEEGDEDDPIYGQVEERTLAALQAIAESNERPAKVTQEEVEGPTDAELAQWWLDFGIDRNITKRNCMTFPYGSKQR